MHGQIRGVSRTGASFIYHPFLYMQNQTRQRQPKKKLRAYSIDTCCPLYYRARDVETNI